jgi:nitrite reductase/ring-hydroxylating ferredoxin subunit
MQRSSPCSTATIPQPCSLTSHQRQPPCCPAANTHQRCHRHVRTPCAPSLCGAHVVNHSPALPAPRHPLQDACPHRLAPLSEGRVDPSTGHLMCNYHGWSFEASGKCSSVPQLASDARASATAIASPRSCVKTYDVRLLHGILWVWPGEKAPERQSAPPGKPLTCTLSSDAHDAC